MTLKERYKKNESRNRHTENYLLLAENFGTITEVKAVKLILKNRNNRGYVNGAESRWLYNNINKYHRSL